MKKLYVISGMTGMTGNELARQIVKSDMGEVIGFDNFFCSGPDTIADIADNSLLNFFEYDLNDARHMDQIAKIVKDKKSGFDELIYINCAAVVHTEYFYHVNSTFETNVLGMKNFLDQAISLNADCFINCSTSEVYSMQSFKEGGVSEDDFLVLANAEHSQRTSYAVGKLMTEFFLKDAVDSGKIRGCSIRFANVYSKNERFAKHIIPHIITSLLKDGKVTLLENSKKNKRTFLHNIDSCASVLALTETLDAQDGTVYNVATDEEISIIDLVYLCAEKIGIKDPEIIFEGYRESDPERRVLSTEKIRSRTDWSPRITLSDGIDMIISCRNKENTGK